MMPKGVEHSDLLQHKPDCEVVKIPMMPKGVEHINQGLTSVPPKV